MDGVAYFVTQGHVKDAIGQYVPDKARKREILVTENSITRSEWNAAGRNGHKAQIVLTTARINYGGESEIEYHGQMYSIYRTYSPPNSDEVELYLEKKVGV